MGDLHQKASGPTRALSFDARYLCHGALGPFGLVPMSSAAELTYRPVGITAPSRRAWALPRSTARCHESSTRIGSGADVWSEAAAAVLHWEVKTRSGFSVDGPRSRVRRDAEYSLRLRIGPVRVVEPVRVVAVVEQRDRVGFAYGTLPGHPLRGEEAFIVERVGDEVHLVIRSVTAPGRGRWRPLFPLVVLLQRLFRRRYLRALRN
jgi:uncharacterized protein (UPF0548 family)